MQRAKALQIYLKPGIEEDELLLAVWDACRRSDRPQDVFRRMLRAGLTTMVENGEMPDGVVASLHLDERVARRRLRATQASLPPYYQPAAAHPPASLPHGSWPWPTPAAAGFGIRPGQDRVDPQDTPGEHERPRQVTDSGSASAKPAAAAPVAETARDVTTRDEATGTKAAETSPVGGHPVIGEGRAAEGKPGQPSPRTTADHADAEASKEKAVARKARIGDIM